MDSGENFLTKTEDLKNKCDQLKEIVSELESLDVLINENLSKFRQDIQDILYFYQADYKFSFLVQGEMNAGKSTCLNALLGQRILAVSSVPETNFITCVVYDKESEIPSLYRTTLSKIYNSQTSSFHISDDSLESTGVKGTENIYSHLNGSNQDSRKKLKELEDQLVKKEEGEQVDSEKVKQELYKDAKLDDTVYVIKCRITSLEDKIKDEFILKRIQLIDFPGMFEYGQNKITEIYKIFEDNTQGLINILHPLGYESNIITKLQNLEKYPNRLLIMINKMDQINIDMEEDEDEYNIEKKAEQLIKNLQKSLRKISNSNANNELQKTKYLQMSQDAPGIVHFVTGKEEMMNTYLSKYRNSTEEADKNLYDSILKSFAEDDQAYRRDLRKAKKENRPFAEMECFEYFEEGRNNLFDKIKDSLAEKFKCRFNELANTEFPEKVNLIRKELIEYIENVMRESEAKQSACVHILFKCQGCEANPIIGVRYRCKVCKDFNYCEKCKGIKDDHPQEHEFEVIENVDLKDQIKNICFKHLNFLVQGFSEYHREFVVQLGDLHSDLTDYYNSIKPQEVLEDLLTSHTARYIERKLEKEAFLKERIREMNASLELVYSQPEVGQDIVLRIVFPEVVTFMKTFAKKFGGICSLLFGTCSNLMQHVIAVTLKQSMPQLRLDLEQDIDPTALEFTKRYDSADSQVYNSSDLSTQSRRWLAKYGLFYSSLCDDLKTKAKNTMEQINATMNLADQLSANFKGDQKAKELQTKLNNVLEKVKEIAPL